MLKPNKKSKYYHASHVHDIFLNLGYKYHGNVYKNTVSPELFYSNEHVSTLIEQLESLINYLIDSAKRIKLQYSIAHNKNDININ